MSAAVSGARKRDFILVVGCWLLVPDSYRDGFWLMSALAIGYWLLAIGFWLLAVGCWLLAVGCWLLAVGFWLLL